MDINKIREKKTRLEKEIESLIYAFERETGVNTDNIYFKAVPINTLSAPRDTLITIKVEISI